MFINEKFEKIKAFGKNIIINIMKWITILMISSLLNIDITDTIILIIISAVDIILLLVLKSEILKNIVNIAPYWVLGPIFQMQLIEEASITKITKTILALVIIIAAQIIEYLNYKKILRYGEYNDKRN